MKICVQKSLLRKENTFLDFKKLLKFSHIYISASASLSGGPSQKAEKEKAKETELSVSKSLFHGSFLGLINLFYLLAFISHFFFFSVFLGKTALLRQAGKERLSIVNMVVWIRKICNSIRLSEAHC